MTESIAAASLSGTAEKCVITICFDNPGKPVTWVLAVCPRTRYALVDSLQEAESLENRFEQVLSPAMRLLSACPQLNYFPTAIRFF
jgi:hypothetical protein